MNDYTKNDLQEALRAVTSMISKCEKCQEKIRQGTSQHTLLKNRIKALRISELLITKEIQ